MLSDAVKSQLDILDYARDIGYTPYRISSRYYSIKEMDSIRINVEKGLWFRNSLVGVRNDVNARGQVGGSVIDFAAYYAPEHYTPDGVRSKTVGGAAMIGLAEKYGIVDDGHYRVFNTSNRYQQSRPRPEPNPSFTKKNEIAEAKTGIYDVPRDLSGEDKVKDYLTRVRGVSENIVQRFIDEDMLYQSMPNHGFSNCVFVSPDNSFGCVHGASETARYVRTLSGSNMNELFFYSPDKADDSSKEKTLVITESIIDAMSVMTQFEREGRSLDDYKFLALAGVTNIGTRDAPKSLAYHLNKPENGNIKKVMLALDNDEAGLRGIDIAQDILLSDFHYQPQDVITYLPPKGKDWNDYIKLNEPVQPVQEHTVPEQETAEPSPVIPDVDIVLHIEGDYDTIKTIRDEFEPLNEEWMGGFASYIHPYSTPESTLMTCEIFDGEHNADELTAIAEKYDVTITRITREDLAAIYTEEYMRELEENSIREISDNPMGIEQTGIASASEQSVQEQEQSHRETGAEPTQQENTPVEVQETAQLEQEQSVTEQESAEPSPTQEQAVTEQEEHKPFKGYIYISAIDFQGDLQETSFLINEGVTSEEVLNIIDYNTGYFEEVRRALRVVGTEFSFNDEENDHPSNGQLEYDNILDEGRITFEIEISDLDSGDYRFTSYNNEKGGIPYGELDLHKNYEITNGTLSYDNALATAYDLQVGDIVSFRSHECTVTDVDMNAIQFTDNSSGKVYTVRSNARGYKGKGWEDILDSGSTLYNYAVIARAGDSYANRRLENVSAQEISHNETEAEPTQQENTPVEVQESAEPIQEQSITEQITAEPSPAQEQENAQPEQEQDVGEADIVATNTAIYSDEELSAMRDSADLTLVDIDYRDKDISANDRMKVALENGLKKILDTEGFKNWLTTRSTDTQKSLSVGNSLRIFAQNPTAHYTASYERWLDFGRQVAKGAQSMAILCPKMPNEAKMVEKATEVYFKLQEQVKKGVEKPTVELYPNSPVKFTMNDKGTMDVSINDKSIKMLPDRHSLELFIKKRLSEHPETYTIGHHFDVKDTIIPDTLWVRKDSGDYKESEIVKDKNGNPNVRKIKGVEKIEIINTPERQARFQPSLGITIEPHDKDKMQRLYEVCVALSKNNGVPVIERTKAEDKDLIGASGYYSAMTSDDCPKGFIVLNADMEISEKCSVLLHEIAHSELHFEPLKLREEMGISRLDTAMKEVQAEAVAYSVAHNFGLETDTASFKYLAAFTSGFDMRQLTTSMDVIVRETEKLTKALTKILDEKGYNLDLSVKENTVNVQELSQEAMNIVTVANDKCTSAMQELPKMMNEYQRDAEIVSTLREQYSAYSTQLGYITNAYDLVDNLNKASTNADKEAIATQLKATLTSISISQETCKALDSKFVEQADKVKGQLRVSFENDSITTLKDMAKSYPSLNLLSDMQLKYIAESKYISANYGRLLKTNPQLFVEKAVERAQQLPLIAGKNGAFVEIVKCEQFTSRPFFENGTLCSPAVANSIFAAAEEKCSEIITQAEEHKESFPTTRCDFCVYAPVDGDLKAYITHIEIGNGEQRNLYDNINQFCELPFKEDLLSACQERPLARSIYVPSVEQISGETEQRREGGKKENMKIEDVVKTFTERSENAKARKAQQPAEKENPKESKSGEVRG